MDIRLDAWERIGNAEEKKSGLRQLFQQYDNALLIGRLAEKYTKERLLQWMDKTTFSAEKRSEAKRIGTFYFRLYNGGTEKVLSLLAAIWLELGYEVIVFTDEPADRNDYRLPDKVKRVVLEYSSEIDAREYGKRAVDFKRKLTENRVDIVIYHAWMSRLLFWDLLLVKTTGLPFMVYTHGVFATPYLYIDEQADCLHKIFQLADGIISLTEVSHRFYQGLGCNSFYMQNPIDPQLAAVPQAGLQGKKVLCIGRISQEKNLLDIVDIFAMAVREVPDATLMVVGEGSAPLLRAMAESCERYRIQDKVEFHGFQDKVGEYYQNASVMIMASEFEGYSLTLLESKAYGVPCVMYELPYLYLTKGGKGILGVPQGDKAGAAAKLVSLLQDPEFRRETGSEAKKSFDLFFSLDLHQSWKEVFARMADGERNTTDETERLMLQMLIEYSNTGRINEIKQIKNLREYKLGQAVLRLPRKVKRKLKGLWKHLKNESV